MPYTKFACLLEFFSIISYYYSFYTTPKLLITVKGHLLVKFTVRNSRVQTIAYRNWALLSHLLYLLLWDPHEQNWLTFFDLICQTELPWIYNLLLKMFHFASRVVICYFCCMEVPIIEPIWRTIWCLLSWTLAVSKNRKFYCTESGPHGFESPFTALEDP